LSTQRILILSNDSELTVLDTEVSNWSLSSLKSKFEAEASN
jgi:hypothetical protein